MNVAVKTQLTYFLKRIIVYHCEFTLAMASSYLFNIFKSPWRNYCRGAALTAAAVFTTNTLTTLIDEDQRNIMTMIPGTMMSLIVGKSLLFAPVWPAWYINALLRPQSAFYLGGGDGVLKCTAIVSEFNGIVHTADLTLSAKDKSCIIDISPLIDHETIKNEVKHTTSSSST